MRDVLSGLIAHKMTAERSWCEVYLAALSIQSRAICWTNPVESALRAPNRIAVFQAEYSVVEGHRTEGSVGET